MRRCARFCVCCLLRARGSANPESRRIARIVEAGKDGDVEALKWWLERRFPKRWGADRMRGKG
jgi:hypothetical protein